MAHITENLAAWITAEKSPVMEVGPGPTPIPGDNEVVIKVAYAAVNPVDWKIQDHPPMPLPYPRVLGSDVAGTIVQLGANVTRFQLGQRAMGTATDSAKLEETQHCMGLITQNPSHAAFQNYCIVALPLVAEVPDNIPLASAVVLPLALSTAICALYKHLKLPFPTLEPVPVGKRILVWGGASSPNENISGSLANERLAKASGYEVITTASPHNTAYVKSLGATSNFDYADTQVIEKLLGVIRKGDVVFDAISSPTSQALCAEIISKIGGGLLPVVDKLEAHAYENVKINSSHPGLVDLDIGEAVWGSYVPAALAAGKLLAKPEPMIIEGGLEKVQEGVNTLRQGVSAKKIVVEIAKEV
ncbi:Dehydrogenase orsE [Lachnellula suecica]|uniref:Dehydrogenase orsE n=1 Tax=Lachnellula suecica TaxID=602035 RepID=A0A8T9CD00_9HELO|nr:Dehydrogenase orsE [Lachnellula suecica]